MDREIEWLLKEKYHGEKSEGFFTDCERLKAGEPLAYIIGFTPFLNTQIWLDSKPLIPRPETENWVGGAIASMRKLMDTEYSSLRVLDLCAGSGAIGVAVLQDIPMARVDFCEIDPSHHANIIKNICENGIDYTTTRIFGGDLFSEIPHGTTYDVILSNPPYIDPAHDRAEKSVKTHEPHRALYGGTEGLEIIERIVRLAPAYLKPKGILYIEHEPEQSRAIITYASTRYARAATMLDQYKVERFTILKKSF